MARITIDEILDKSQGGLLFYKKIMPQLDLSKSARFRLKNPFYNDKNPSMTIYYKNGKWNFHDYGDTEYSGDVFKFAAYYYGLDLEEDFRLILEKMNDDLDGLEFVPKHKYSEQPEVNINKTFELIKTRNCEDFLPEELAYFNQYGITKEAMEAFDVVAVDEYWNGKFVTRPKDFMWFGYLAKDYVKIYCPSPKKGFWYIGTKPSNYIFGSPIDYYSVGEKIFITGGEKDVLSLVSRGYLALCLNSETANIPETLLKSLHSHQLNPVILFDNDETGVKAAQDLSYKHNIKMLSLPEDLRDCGGKDISDFFRLGYSDKQLDEIEPVLFSRNETSTTPAKTSLSLRTAKQRLDDAKGQPEIAMMLDVFMHSGELAILFGDTGIGKSILAVSIADVLSRGVSLMGLHNQCPPQKVIYYDFELSDKQFEKRYSDENGNAHQFSDNLYTDCLDFSQFTSTDRKVKFEHLLIEKLRSQILEVGANVIIIDNITYLSTQTSQDAQVAMELMKLLKQLKEELNISVLVLAHTPKRPPTEGIAINHLAGSKHISNFADSVFAIGTSKNDKGFRYMKQVKPSRSGEFKFDDRNVLKCELVKKHDFLTFDFSDFCEEQLLLATLDEDSEEEARALAIELKNSGMTIRDIATKVGFSKSKVGRWLKGDG